jgi:hypothetical protein
MVRLYKVRCLIHGGDELVPVYLDSHKGEDAGL